MSHTWMCLVVHVHVSCHTYEVCLTHSYVRCDSFVSLHHMTHSYVWRDSRIYVTCRDESSSEARAKSDMWSLHTCDMTHSSTTQTASKMLYWRLRLPPKVVCVTHLYTWRNWCMCTCDMYHFFGASLESSLVASISAKYSLICREKIQPIADKVAQNLEINSKTLSTYQNSAHGMYN